MPTDFSSMGRNNYVFCYGDSQRGSELIETEAINETSRGAFQLRNGRGLNSILDGLSNTIGLGEVATALNVNFNDTTPEASIRGYQTTKLPEFTAGRTGVLPSACLATSAHGRYKPGLTTIARRGMHWGNGISDFSGFNTILPPNGPSCIMDTHHGPGIHTSTSYHPGGSHTLMLDLAVRFVTNDIDAGKSDLPSPGAYWHIGNLRYTPAWNAESPYGVWGALGTIAAGETKQPIE